MITVSPLKIKPTDFPVDLLATAREAFVAVQKENQNLSLVCDTISEDLLSTQATILSTSKRNERLVIKNADIKNIVTKSVYRLLHNGKLTEHAQTLIDDLMTAYYAQFNRNPSRGALFIVTTSYVWLNNRGEYELIKETSDLFDMLVDAKTFAQSKRKELKPAEARTSVHILYPMEMEGQS